MKTTSITFRLTEKEKETLMNLAKAQDIPVSQLVRGAVKNLIQEGTLNVSRKSIQCESK